jgi:OOP family OmpA-OmpF porin
MKRKIIVALALLAGITLNTHAQSFLKKMQRRAGQAVTNRAGDEVEKGVNKAADSALKAGKKKPGDKSATETTETTSTATQEVTAAVKQDKKQVEAYSKFDFVPGDQLLLSDDFAQDALGEFAVHWNTNNKGEVVKMEDGVKWLKLFQQSTYLTPNKRILPEDYTIEFDLILQMQSKGYLYPEITFTLFNSGKLSPVENAVFKAIRSTKAVAVNWVLGASNNTYTVLRTYANGSETYKTSNQLVKTIEDNYGKPMHIAISVQKQRFRLWVNEQKVYDLPKVVEDKFNQLAITLSESNYTEDQLAFYFTNFKLAAGSPDIRSKLLNEGKYITNGITFDVNSDQIKPSSYGIIKEIAAALQSDAAFNIQIIGHTDSDGAKANNDNLSLKRAAAVKAMLVDTYKIGEARISVSGKGSSAPVADNNTAEGKAKNRRVEFVKLAEKK